MDDLLYVGFDKNERQNETGLCVGRVNSDGSHSVLKMVLDDEAKDLYELLTNQTSQAIIIPEGITRREMHKLVFGIDVPELHSDKFRCAREKGCSNCKHKDNINCDMNWWNAPFKKGN